MTKIRLPVSAIQSRIVLPVSIVAKKKASIDYNDEP